MSDALPHITKRVKVWANVDVGIADLVEYLQTIEGVTTQASCQGTLGEGGPNPYRPQVLCTWDDESVLKRLESEFDVTHMGPSWGYVHPR